ncbi:transglycosylase SLT domain-containing protein [Granulicella rosea]|uniref:lytic transglycosylase domain-containing protein n=1 Tax=Granulicella rosea TaxID=474952 RepID=UPI001FE51FBC|nr:transglycosylase SLT domain-containing protein [Granulicella rosea]
MVGVAGLALAIGLPCGLDAQTRPKKKPVARSGKASAKKAPTRKGGVKAGHKPAGNAAAEAASAKASAQSARLTSAFVASAQLRPMAQQLSSTRSSAAYSGVLGYAQAHTGEASATAYLALGHSYTLDHRYGDAVEAYKLAGVRGDVLDDYADYLGAQSAVQAGRGSDAYGLLDHFADRHPDSIFVNNAPVLLANAYLQQQNPAGAVKVLTPLIGSAQADHPDFEYTLGRAYQLSGDRSHAIPLFRAIFVGQPLTPEAAQARTQLLAMGAPPSAAERKIHADQLFNAKHYSEAMAEYNAVRNDSSLSVADKDALEIYTAVCQLKLKHLGRRDVEKLPVTNDDSAALKLYLFAEISRTEKNRTEHDDIINRMVKEHPQSRWLEEALYSGGNMYLLTHDAPQAIFHYKLLVERFPNSVYAPSAHWRAAWLNYRLRNYSEAARLMDEQILRYSAGIEAPTALYWRGRIYEDEERNFGQAVNYYRALSDAYSNYYYGELARQRIAVLGKQAATPPSNVLSYVRKLQVPPLTGAVPENDPHYIKAKLLANAALNEYIGPEIQASPTANQWGALAQAQIYASYGEYTRALQSMKHSGISFFTLPFGQVPVEYWRLMFPQPYWQEIVADAQKNGLDPYLVASLIRQESEFNPGAVSPAHAYGLMQLLPSVGKENARREGMKGFQTNMLLNPATNIDLGTRNLKSVLDRFGGQPEYALAAYNAGDVPVRQWMALGNYKDVAEYVESIPYTETREYVQAILRNREMYRALYPTH